MKIIAMMPVRNEALILPAALKCLETFCDRILIADHQSTDDTVAVAAGFKKVEVIKNNSHEIRAVIESRAALLDAFRSFDGNNFGLCIDADEITPPSLFANFRREIERVGRPGMSFSFWWVQLWRSLDSYRSDSSAWSNSWKPMGFFDDRKMFFPDDQNRAHESRIPVSPGAPEATRLPDFPVLHLQWAYWDRTQYKQAWYRAVEFIYAGFSNAAEINSKYSITLGDAHEGLAPTKPEWLAGVSIPQDMWRPTPNWHRDEILKLFQQHGISRFEPLQVWHIKDLHDLFVSQAGREPVHAVMPVRKPSLAFRAARRVVPAPVRAVLRKLIR